MGGERHAAAEHAIRSALDAGDVEGAARAALDAFGPELYGYAAAMVRDPDRAGDVFSQFSEDVWRGLPGFRWSSSFRTWAYTLLRHAIHRHQRSPHEKRRVNLSESPISRLELAVRERTQPYLRTEVKDRMRALREQLDPDDQAILILRVDREMAWEDIAQVLHGEALAKDEQRRRSASLRKRFERIKQRLRDAAEAEGILDG